MKIDSHSNPLSELIAALHHQNDTLGKARNDYLTLEAQRKYHEARLINGMGGKSHAERVVNAQATEAWVNLHKELARAEAVYEFQKLKFSVMEKEYMAQYLMHKLDGSLIKKEQ